MVLRSMLLIAGLFVLTSLIASDFPQITNIQARNTMVLDGQWKYIVDPMETGYLDYRRKPYKSGYPLDKKQNNPELIEYNFDAAPDLRVPGDWNTQQQSLYYYEGTVWYRKKFNYNLSDDKRLFLHFGAVNYACVVYLNGLELGKHEGGYTPFNFELTGKIKKGENSLVVKVDNKRKIEHVPTDNFDWWNYGGITRSVTLIETPKVFIRDYFIQLKKNNDNLIKGWVHIDGVVKSEQLSISIPELKKHISIKSDNKGYAEFELNAKPELWSPESPKLYDVEISFSNESQIKDKIGFRTIETKGNKLLLNGKPIFCRGVCVHEEAPLRSAKAYSREDAITLISWAKEMGCNFLRLAHYTHNEHMIREAERLGIMLWAEVPVYWTIEWGNAKTLESAKSQMTEMITRDKNRCNIIIWSVANETPQSDERLTFLKSLIDHTRSLDNTRLVSAALEKEQITPGLMTVHDELSNYLDVLSFNQYIGWYGGTPEKCETVNWKLPTDKPIIVSEYGGGALSNLHGDKSERWTEEFQEDLYIKTIDMFKRTDGISGTTPWLLMDFRSPKRLLNGIQDEYNRKGLISNYGEKKKAFYIMKTWYDELINLYK